MKMSKMDKWLCIILESDIDGTKRIFNSDGKGEEDNRHDDVGGCSQTQFT